MTWGIRPIAALIARRAGRVLGGGVLATMLVSCGGQADEAPAADSAATPAAPVEAAAQAVPGVTDDQVLFGQSAAFRGPAGELGSNMEFGIRAAFSEVNRRGGVHGRQLQLLSLDDAYEPEAAIANTRQLIEETGVFALIGAVGTPTSRSAVPVALEAGVPYIAPFTGAEFLRSPDLPNVINMRASYYQETEEMVKRLTTDLGVTRISVLYQDDSYGRAGYNGVRLALENREMEMVSIGVYTRNTTAVKAALLDIRRGDPEAVIIIGAYQPVAAFIAWAKHMGLDAIFMTVSFVGSYALAEELGPAGTGVFVTQVVPFPADREIPLVKAYYRALEEFAPFHDVTFVSLEGYLAGRLAIEGLERCGPELTRECFLESLREAGRIEIEEFVLDYGPTDNQGSDSVFLTMIGPDGEYQPVSTLRDIEP